MALGAGRSRLVRGWLAEALVSPPWARRSAWCSGTWLTTTRDGPGARGRAAHGGRRVRAPVLLFVGAVTVGMALFTGLIAAWQSREVTVHDTLMRTGRTAAGAPSAWVRGVLIGGQVALTLTLLVSARSSSGASPSSAASTSGSNRRAWSPSTRGCRPAGSRSPRAGRGFGSRSTTTRCSPSSPRYPACRPWAAPSVCRSPVRAPRGTSGWRSAAATGALPPAEAQWKVTIDIVTPGYFRAMGMHVVRGRSFQAEDRLTEEQLTNPDDARPRGVAIVNEAFARRFFPGQEPIGRSLVLFDHWAVSASTIVGIVDRRATTGRRAGTRARGVRAVRRGAWIPTLCRGAEHAAA
jgi:putative ABC transport system permease protein